MSAPDGEQLRAGLGTARVAGTDVAVHVGIDGHGVLQQVQIRTSDASSAAAALTLDEARRRLHGVGPGGEPDALFGLDVSVVAALVAAIGRARQTAAHPMSA